MKFLLFLTVVASSLTVTTLPAKTHSHPKAILNSPLHLLAETGSGVDYNKREYTSYIWYIKNVGPGNVWLPLSKDRFSAKSTPPRHFFYRTRGAGSWSTPRLADHEINYETDWVLLPPGEKHQLFTTTFYKESEKFKAVEVSLSYRDDGGKIHKEKLSWSAVSQPYNKSL